MEVGGHARRASPASTASSHFVATGVPDAGVGPWPAALGRLCIKQAVGDRRRGSGRNDDATGLPILELPGSAVSDLGALSELNLLLHDLSDNAVVGTGPLAGLTRLTRLFPSLWYLDLDDNAITDIEPLSRLTGPRRLYFSGTGGSPPTSRRNGSRATRTWSPRAGCRK